MSDEQVFLFNVVDSHLVSFIYFVLMCAVKPVYKLLQAINFEVN